MPRWIALAGALVPAIFSLSPAAAEPYFGGFQAEQLEYRTDGDDDIFAWDFDAFFGTDELRFVWRSEAEYDIDEDAFETLENQARFQTPISDFFDAVVGARVDTPSGPDRAYGVLGVHGLAQQWFEIDADLFISDNPQFRFEAEYEGLITNRVILTPSVPKLEVGARLSYDLIDRALSPYIGVHYERLFGESGDLARDEGEDRDQVLFVVGARLMF
jgi:copper resistance protein B